MFESPYQGYLYGYPHKTAYRALDVPVRLDDAWAADEPTSLYLHVPFCEMRCGFCNLFTLARPSDALIARWEERLEREVDAAVQATGGGGFRRFAIGGGTPSWLDDRRLERLFHLLSRFGTDLRSIPGSVEVSPSTVTASNAALLVERGTTRVSMGVQSLIEAETEAVFRHQSVQDVLAAVQCLRDARVPIVNLDLIYGLPGQTERSFRESLSRVIELAPEEVFAYPLYVRAQTGLGRHGGSADDDHRLALYRVARDMLRAAGYHQRTMRSFTRADPTEPYPCQDDGLVGVGVGARSYTRGLHWSSEFAVAAHGIRRILEDWVASEPGWVRWGIRLDEQEQRRRFVILSLLGPDGLSRSEYERRFGPLAAEPLDVLVEHGLAAWDVGVLRLTEAGLERSDAVGPWLVSPAVRARMEQAVVA